MSRTLAPHFISLRKGLAGVLFPEDNHNKSVLHFMDFPQIETWLREKKSAQLEKLWQEADQVRERSVGNAVHLRGLLEISNHCSRDCQYCGIRGGRKNLERFRMTRPEIEQCIRQLAEFGYGTVVLQAGEDPGITPSSIEGLVDWIKQHTDLAITLSLGEQTLEVLKRWKEAGADRYLLKIETTDPVLLDKIQPGRPYGSRMDTLDRLSQLGYEVGSGIMVGIPGQTYEMVAKDIQWFKDMDLDMIGIGPFIPHKDTPLSDTPSGVTSKKEQVSGTETMANKVIALSRIVCPEANIPATTALASINTEFGREKALSHGANIVMPNVTPKKYSVLYDIYPGKACISETADVCHSCIKNRIKSIGREIGVGLGSRKRAESLNLN